ncbi:putative transcription factor & chromatin remodeling ARID family [Helianthus annuus]|nr:putative transcription factor & chromatin remodeling ARID family [Helianthus annuus]
MSYVETITAENHFFFVRGIGVVDVISGPEKIRVQSVFYTSDIDINVLSFDQLITQGFTVKFIGDKCKLFPTFSVPLNNRRNGHTGLIREEEIGELEKQYVIGKGHEHEKYKSDFLNEYFEKLNITTNEPDWNILILQVMSFKDFKDCKALLDMLEDEDYFIKYKYYLEDTFNNMIEWFLKEKLEIHSRPLPAYASNNRKVRLLDLYMAVKREGGHRRITENGIWAMIAKDIGFEYDDGEYMRLIYAMYLDVLVYYYKFKMIQENALEKEEVKMAVDPRQSNNEGDMEVVTDTNQTDLDGRSRSAGAANKDAEHYAFFAGNDWKGIKKLNMRQRFDFSRAKAAVDDANDIVLKNSRKQNYV